MVIPMAVLPAWTLERRVSKSDISAIIIQVKNRREDASCFTTDFMDTARFDIRHISGLSEREDKPYLGLWLSFGATNDDLSIEGYPRPFKADRKPSRFGRLTLKVWRRRIQSRTRNGHLSLREAESDI